MNDDPKPLSNFTLAKQIAALPRDVSPMQRLFLHTLLIHRNATTGLCYPSLETIAKEMGSCPVTPKRSQRELVKMGYLTVDKVVTEAGKVNSYTINLPDTFVSSSRDLCISVIHKQRNKTDINIFRIERNKRFAAPFRPPGSSTLLPPGATPFYP